MTDDLSAPLSRRSTRARAAGAMRRGFPLARTAIVLLVLVGLGIAARLYLVDDPTGGRPTAEAEINSTRDANPIAADMPPVVAAGGESDLSAAGPTIVTLNGTNEPDIQVADIGPVQNEQGVFPDLAEETPDGPIPRISSAGDTPFKTYARASITPETADGRPLVAILVTGLGLSEPGTLAALDKLPENVSLAFAPYGRNLRSTTAAARQAGHELFLEVPLEPFDYPDNDPGPQTLLTGQPPRANIDKLLWLMARFGGYAGLVNHMGARFTASAADFSPMMEELGTRGLGYLDDGTSNRSLAPQLAATNKVPFRRADMLLDTNPNRAAILDALAKLEEKARTDGAAIGVVSALPVSIDTIAEWSAALEQKGIVLVPATALMK